MLHGSHHETIMPEKFLRAHGWYVTPHSLGKAGHNRLKFLGYHCCHERLWLEQAPSNQPDYMMITLGGVLAEFKNRPSEKLKNFRQWDRLAPGLLLRLIEHGQPGLVHWLQSTENNFVV